MRSLTMADRSPDNAKMRESIYSLMAIPTASAILDVGCGDGYDLQRIGALASRETRLVGLDASPEQVKIAAKEMERDPRYSFALADISRGLPCAGETFDIVFSNNVLECIPDKDALLRELHRVLRPQGQVVFAHFDFDSQLFDGVDKGLVRKLTHAAGDWQQKWMADCDAWMGRRLWRTFRHTGLFEGSIHTYVLTNTEFDPDHYGYHQIANFAALVRHGLISQQEHDAFREAIEDLARRGEYFYSITMFIYVGRKIGT
jgi:ubiquinone/menaquinone biosynthesis C-methylase UbiE